MISRRRGEYRQIAIEGLRARSALSKDQEPRRARCEARGGGGLGSLRTKLFRVARNKLTVKVNEGPYKKWACPLSTSRPNEQIFAAPITPPLIFQVVGLSRDDVLTATRRREAIIPARTRDCLLLLRVVP
jgi:hypothetical protein